MEPLAYASLWRWILFGSAAVVTLSRRPDAVGGLLVGLLVVGGFAVERFEPSVHRHWQRRGWLFGADLGLVGMALIAGDLPARLIGVALFLAAGVSLAIGDRTRATLASTAVVAALAILTAIAAPTLFTSWVLLAVAPILLAAATIHFSDQAQALSAPRAVERSAAAKRPSGQMWALLEITELVGTTLELPQVLRSVVARVGDLMGTESCSIMLAEEGSDNMFVMASKGHPDLDMLELDLGDYPEVRQAIAGRETVVVQDVASSDLLPEATRERLTERGYKALLVLPLIFGDRVLGALTVRSASAFGVEEIRFCKVVAGASANAIKNALLYREMQHEAEQNRAIGEKLRRLLDCTPDMIVATDVEGRITEFNDGAEVLTGRSAESAIGQRLDELLDTPLADEGLEARYGNRPRPERASAPGELVFSRPDGGQVEISLVHAPLTNREGDARGRVWIGRDVTKLRRVEKSLVHAERLSSLGEVVAGVAHELNNPLSGVVGYAELLRVNATEPDQIRDLDRIVDSSIRCQKIVMKLLSFARQHPPEKRLQSINDCVQKVLDLKSYHLRSSQIETRLDLETTLPQSCFDFHQVEQVVLNLLNNAEQAIGSKAKPGTVILRTLGAEEGTILIEVEDDGPGIPDSSRERIFDPFFTTKELGEGTGLGLSVSFGIIEEHGGRIEVVEPRELGGACFRVTLPVIEGEPVELDGALPAPAGEGLLEGSKILVAEDEPLCLELFGRVLRDEGADVQLAKDGLEAWQRLRDGEFDLVIVDLRMPNLSGQELYERVAEERPDLLRRLVFATGDLVRPETTEFLQGLPNRILQKPLEVETVRRVLGQAVSAR